MKPRYYKNIIENGKDYGTNLRITVELEEYE